jgi:hypothetical protein
LERATRDSTTGFDIIVSLYRNESFHTIGRTFVPGQGERGRTIGSRALPHRCPDPPRPLAERHR